MSLLPHFIVKLDAVCHNYRLIKKFVGGSQTAAVVKNNAYGVGAMQVAKILYEQENCRIFFVAYATEGAEIRPFVPDATIYLLNGFCRQDVEIIKKYNLIPVLSSMEQIKNWEDCQMNSSPAIQVETGLNRLGVTYAQIEQMSPEMRHHFSLVLSHLACADEPQNSLNKKQRENLKKIQELFPKSMLSLSASDGIGLGKNYHFDVVRAGAFMYGLPVCPALEKERKTVVNAYAKILQIKELKKGDGVGYNSLFIAQKACKVAAIGVGYGDGLFRSLSGKGRVFFRNENKNYAAPIVGQISMDITMCDVSDVPPAALATQKAYLFSDTYNLNDMGQDAGSISYEVLSALGRGQRWLREMS